MCVKRLHARACGVCACVCVRVCATGAMLINRVRVCVRVRARECVCVRARLCVRVCVRACV